MPSNVFPKCKKLSGKGIYRDCNKYGCKVDAIYCHGCGGDNVCKFEYIDGILLKCKRFKWVIGEIGENSHKVCKICRNRNYHLDR